MSWWIREWLLAIVVNALSEDAIVWLRRLAVAVGIGFVIYGLVSGNAPVGMFGFLAVLFVVLPRLILYRR